MITSPLPGRVSTQNPLNHPCRAFLKFSFTRGAILAFEENDIEEPSRKRGTLIFTGATASTRSNVVTSAFATGKFGARALSQNLAKQFGKENIQVAHLRLYQVILSRFNF